MSKSILVIDTPKICDECEFCYWSDGRFRTCGITHMGISKQDLEYIGKTKPDWCPLSLLPEKMIVLDINDIYEHKYTEGWNDCLDEIIGEINEINKFK